MNKTAHSVCKRSSARLPIQRNNWSLLSSVLIILLPKCSLCVTAYAGAVAMCSGKSLMDKMGSFGHVLSLVLGLVIVISIVSNGRGWRTIMSLALVVIALLLIGLTQAQWIVETFYYVGSLLLFIGIWVNGSLFYILRKSKKHFNILKSKLPIA